VLTAEPTSNFVGAFSHSLSKLFAAMSEDEYRHAELLMKLLGRKMNV